ncbi:MAG TPA: hypothetical protein VJ793_06260 [Anaerolineae bacterium]|nr:hypothetical protein [Anaerolineae bacterium]
MADRLDELFQEWHRLGGQVLVAEVDSALPIRSPERVIAESTACCRDSGRLTWVVLGWLTRNIAQIDEEDLLREMRERGVPSVLGVLCDAANQRNPHPKFERIMRACAAAERLEPFFRRVAQSRLAMILTQENPLEVFRRWNYLCNELRYL